MTEDASAGTRRTIRIEGTGKVSAPADITVVEASISGVNATFNGAMKALARCTRQVKDAVEKAGIPRDDLKSSQLSIEQNYREEKIGEDRHGNDKFRQVPDGFAYRQNVKFEFPSDEDKLSAAIENIMACDVEPRITFSFRNSDEAAMNDKAIAEASRNAMREARIILESTGSRLGRLVHAQVGDFRPTYGCRNEVMYAAKAMDCSARMDFDPEDIEYVQNVTLEWEIEDRSGLEPAFRDVRAKYAPDVTPSTQRT